MLAGLSPADFSITAQDYNSGLSASATGQIVSAASPILVDLTLPPSGTVTGVLRDGAGDPVIGADVTASSSGLGFDRSAVTDENGAFRFEDMALGTITVRAFAGDLVAETTAELTTDGQTLHVTLTLPVTGSVSGRVFDTDQAPLAGASVIVETRYGVTSRTTYTDDAGRYSLPFVQEGPVRVTATVDYQRAGYVDGNVTGGVEATLDVTFGNAVMAGTSCLPGGDEFDYYPSPDGSLQIWSHDFLLALGLLLDSVAGR